MFGHEPDLHFVGTHELTHDEVVGAVVAGFVGLARKFVAVLEDALVGIEQARDLHGGFFAVAGHAGDAAQLGHIVGHSHGHAAQNLDALGNLIYQIRLLFVVLVEEQVQLVERGAHHLPVVFFVHIAQRHGIGQQLVEGGDTGLARFLVEADGQALGHGAVALGGGGGIVLLVEPGLNINGRVRAGAVANVAIGVFWSSFVVGGRRHTDEKNEVMEKKLPKPAGCTETIRGQSGYPCVRKAPAGVNSPFLFPRFSAPLLLLMPDLPRPEAALAPHPEHHLTSSVLLQNVVIGLSDGLTVPFALAAGLSGALATSDLVITAGLAEIVAGSIAMGLGGYLAGRTEVEHYEAELARERREVREVPDVERAEVDELLAEMGLSVETRRRAVAELTADSEQWVRFMMKYELGLEAPDPHQAPKSAATISSAYAVGGLIPLSAYFFTATPTQGLLWSAAITLVCLLVFGFFKSRITGQPAVAGALKMALVGALAAAAAFGVARRFA